MNIILTILWGISFIGWCFFEGKVLRYISKIDTSEKEDNKSFKNQMLAFLCLFLMNLFLIIKIII